MTPTFIKLRTLDGREINLNRQYIAAFGKLRDGRGSWLLVGENGGDYHVIEQPKQITSLLGLTADEPAPAPAEPTLEDRVKSWVVTRIGDAHMQSTERAMRLVEEAVELAQAEGIPLDMVRQQADHVYVRPVGEPRQEAAGVAVCLLGWCAANNCTLGDLAEREIQRIEAKPIDQIRGSLARKADADLVVAVDAPAEPANPEPDTTTRGSVIPDIGSDVAPDYRALLKDLVRAIEQESVNTYQWDSHNVARLNAAVAAVRP